MAGYFQPEIKFYVGDRVRIKSSVDEPRYQWGALKDHHEVGTIRKIVGEDVYVFFESFDSQLKGLLHERGWQGLLSEIELVLEPVSSLSSNFRGGVNKKVTTDIAYKLRPQYTFEDLPGCELKNNWRDLVEEDQKTAVLSVEFEDDKFSGRYGLYITLADFEEDLDENHESSGSNEDCSCSCWSWDQINKYFERVTDTMSSLKDLTEAQKTRLTKDDQALTRMGWVDCNLEYTEAGRDVYLRMKMDEDYKQLAARAGKEVARIEAEEAKKKADK